MTPDYQAAAKVISGADSIVMACHVGPDGDGVGSMLAMALAARAAGKKVFPSFGSPFEPPASLAFLPLELLVPPDRIPADPELFIAFDTGSLERLAELAPVAKAAAVTVVVDHHPTNEGFGEVAVIDPTASSTAELTFTLLRRLGWAITPEVAQCLLTGIVTDTGRFQYSNTHPATLVAAAQLVAAGARPEVIGRHVYEEAPFGYLGVVSAVAGRAVLEAERRFVWSVLYPEDLETAGVGLGDVDPLIDVVRLPRESDVALLVKVIDTNTVRGSLRSRGRVDVGTIAAALGGGGHHNAAGFTLEGSPLEAVEAVRSRLPDA